MMQKMTISDLFKRSGYRKTKNCHNCTHCIDSEGGNWQFCGLNTDGLHYMQVTNTSVCDEHSLEDDGK